MTHPGIELQPETAVDPILERNINALRKNNRALADELAVMEAGGEDPGYPGWSFEVRDAHNGQPTLVAVNGSEEVALHSTYDPEREAADQVSGALSREGRNYFVVLGFGLGYAVQELARRVENDSKIAVVEPHIAAFRIALSTRDLSDVLTDPRVIVSLGNNIDNSLSAFLRRYVLADCRGVGFIELAGRAKLPSKEFYATLLERLKGVMVTTGGNLQTLMLMAWTYQKNTMASLGNIVDSPPVRTLFDAFEGKPAIIVSAGPSLQKNIDRLKDLRDKVVLIAVDTSLKPLLAAGVEPHLVCTGDPQEANWLHLRGAETTDAYLVAEPMTYPASLTFFKDRLFIASYNDKVMKWLAKFIPDVGHVLCWGSVATMGFDLARKMGCDPIIFVGQDLSFSGGRTYVKGTYFEDEKKMDMSVEAFEKKNIIYNVTDIFGNEVKTNRQMFAYKEWFRTEFSRTQAAVINATEGGILKDNCEIMQLREAAEKYLSEEFDAIGRIREVSTGFEGYDLEPLCRAMFDNIKSMRRCIEMCEKSLDLVRDGVRSLENMTKLPPVWCAKLIGDLDAIRFQLMEERALKDFLETANQVGVFNFKRAYEAVNGKDFSRVVFREALDLFTDLYMSTGRTARGVLPFFLMGFKEVARRTDEGGIEMEEICQMTT